MDRAKAAMVANDDRLVAILSPMGRDWGIVKNSAPPPSFEVDPCSDLLNLGFCREAFC